MKVTIHAFCIFYVCGTFGFPMDTNSDTRIINPEEISDNFEGDMILTQEQILVLRNETKRYRARKYRWPQKTVKYRFLRNNFTTEQIALVHNAMDTIENVSCIKFKERPFNFRAHVIFVALKPGCFSAVGYQDTIQMLNLFSDECFRPGALVHQLLHTLGFYHMQNAANRDSYVRIQWANIDPKYKENFTPYGIDRVTDFSVEYDYGSVMHYSDRAFSINGKPTIIPIDPDAKIGQRDGMSEKDIIRLNRMYRCKKEKTA